MEINDDVSVKELEQLKRKIEKKIKAKKSPKIKKVNYYDLIKDDHKKHLRKDGRKLFRSVVDYLDCYVNGLPPVAKANFYERFGVESRRKKISPVITSQVKNLLLSGCTLKEAAEKVGVSIASCQKIRKGEYDS